jgi:RNA polymerase sigma-70 factor (ECF subfamily)
MLPRAQSSPDAELIRGFLEGGDNECFAELFMRHRKNIYFSCRRFFSESRAAEDATQETFLRAYRNLRSFQGGDFSSWLMRIARNICVDEYRKARPEVHIGDTELAEMPGRASAPLHAQLMANRIRQEIKSLSPEQRQCLEMKIEGYSYEETSARTGFSVEAVKSYIQNGRRMLWRKMEGALPQPK